MLLGNLTKDNPIDGEDLASPIVITSFWSRTDRIVHGLRGRTVEVLDNMVLGDWIVRIGGHPSTAQKSRLGSRLVEF